MSGPTYGNEYTFTLRSDTGRYRRVLFQTHRETGRQTHKEAIRRIKALELCPIGAIEKIECSSQSGIVEINPHTAVKVKR